MPLELDQDEWSGEPYRAYLVEMRSLGGLSGSPVYVMTPPEFKRDGESRYLDQKLRLLGLIRGHWAHSGLAIVTPVDELVNLLNRKDLAEERER